MRFTFITFTLFFLHILYLSAEPLPEILFSKDIIVMTEEEYSLEPITGNDEYFIVEGYYNMKEVANDKELLARIQQAISEGQKVLIVYKKESDNEDYSYDNDYRDIITNKKDLEDLIKLEIKKAEDNILNKLHKQSCIEHFESITSVQDVRLVLAKCFE